MLLPASPTKALALTVNSRSLFAPLNSTVTDAGTASAPPLRDLVGFVVGRDFGEVPFELWPFSVCLRDRAVAVRQLEPINAAVIGLDQEARTGGCCDDQHRSRIRMWGRGGLSIPSTAACAATDQRK